MTTRYACAYVHERARRCRRRSVKVTGVPEWKKQGIDQVGPFPRSFSSAMYRHAHADELISRDRPAASQRLKPETSEQTGVPEFGHMETEHWERVLRLSDSRRSRLEAKQGSTHVRAWGSALCTRPSLGPPALGTDPHILSSSRPIATTAGSERSICSIYSKTNPSYTATVYRMLTTSSCTGSRASSRRPFHRTDAPPRPPCRAGTPLDRASHPLPRHTARTARSPSACRRQCISWIEI
jgi:hypothetical protein